MASAPTRSAAHGLPVSVPQLPLCSRPLRPRGLLSFLCSKKLFYDARDPRLSRDSYMSCASCHNDAGGDGRVWDMTGLGEGLRETVSLKGRGGMAQGFLHWSQDAGRHPARLTTCKGGRAPKGRIPQSAWTGRNARSGVRSAPGSSVRDADPAVEPRTHPPRVVDAAS